MEVARYEHRDLAVTCELQDGPEAGLGERIAEWRSLRDSRARSVETIPGGARLWLDPISIEVVNDLAKRESSCCRFLDIELAIEGDRLRLDVTSPAPDGAGVIATLLGI